MVRPPSFSTTRKYLKVLVSLTTIFGLLSTAYVVSNTFLSATKVRAAAMSTSGPISSIDLSNSTLDEGAGQERLFGGSLIPGSDTTSGLTAIFTTGTATWVNGTNSGSLTSGVISQVPVKRGENTIIITHTAPDTTQTAYTIYVRRAGQWTGFDIRTPGVTMTPAFTSSIHEYTLTDVPYSVSSLTHIVTHSYEEPGHLSCNRCDWWQYSSRGEQTMGLNPGANRIEWVYSSGETTETYYINVNRASAFDTSTLSSLTLSNSTLDERGGALYIYGGSLIPGSDTTSGLTATFTTGTATWVNGTNSGSLTSGVISQVPVKRGENTIIITHTAPDTTQTAYTIYVRRAGQWTGFDIRTPGVTMTPAFTSSVHYYTMTDVPYSVSSLTHIVTHSFEEPGHLSCNRCDWWQYSSRGEQTMGLTPGANCIEWVYSSGETTETYYFAINRNSPGSPPTSNCVEPPPTTTTTTTTLPPETTTTTTEPEATTTVPRTTTTVARTTTTVPRTTATVVDVVPSSGSGASDSGANSTNSPTETSAPLVVSDTPNTTAAPATTSAPTTTTEPEQVDETTTTNPVVADLNAPEVPEVEIGSAVATINGKKVDVKITTKGNKITFSVGGISGELDGSSQDGSAIQLDADGNLVLMPGDAVSLNLAGFGSDTPEEVWMFSIPVKVKDLMADAEGKSNGSFLTPQGIDAGSHRIVVKGRSPENDEVIIAVGVTVIVEGSSSLTSRLVLPITITVVVLFIVALTIRLRRRSKLDI
jgi:hypothetical protein